MIKRSEIMDVSDQRISDVGDQGYRKLGGDHGIRDVVVQEIGDVGDQRNRESWMLRIRGSVM